MCLWRCNAKVSISPLHGHICHSFAELVASLQGIELLVFHYLKIQYMYHSCITSTQSIIQKVVSESYELFKSKKQSLERIRTDQVRDLTTHIFPIIGVQQDENTDK